MNTTRHTSFAHQKDVLVRFSDVLKTVREDLLQLSVKYESTLYSLYEEEGLMEEIYSDYQVLHMESLMASFESLAHRIAEEDIPFVEEELRFFSSRKSNP